MFFVCIVTNKRNGTLYTGHTDDLARRIWEHKEKAYKGFSAKYSCDKLVWYESHETRDSAFTRERQIKKWNRNWKLQLIENGNSKWRDLYEGLTVDDVYDEACMYVPRERTGSPMPRG